MFIIIMICFDDYQIIYKVFLIFLFNLCVIKMFALMTVISKELCHRPLKALVRGHPQGAKKVSVTGAGHSREYENTEFVWEFIKSGFD